jgi:hypothetical protein
MICPVHDVAYQDGGSCWCCDLQSKEKGSLEYEPPVPVTSNERIDAPLPPRQAQEPTNLHCGKHDTIYSKENPCRGCQMESALSSGQDSPSASNFQVKTGADAIKGPDDTLAELRGSEKPLGKESGWPAWLRSKKD